MYIILENPFMYMLSSAVYYTSWIDVFNLIINVLFRWCLRSLLIDESLLIRLRNSLRILLLKLPIQNLKILICQNMELQGCFPLSSFRFRLVSHSFVKNDSDLVNNMVVLEIIFAPLSCWQFATQCKLQHCMKGGYNSQEVFGCTSSESSKHNLQRACEQLMLHQASNKETGFTNCCCHLELILFVSSVIAYILLT